MEEKETPAMKTVKMKWFIPVVALLLICLLLGSFFDLQVSTAIYLEKSAFSEIMAVLGSLPAYVLLGFIGPLFYVFFKDQKFKLAKFLAYAAFIGAPLVGGLGFGLDALHDVSSNKIMNIVNGIIIIEIINFVLYFFYFNQIEKKDVIRDAHIIGFTIGFTVLVGLFFKEIVVRPRFLYVAREFTERRFIYEEDFYRWFDWTCKLTVNDVGRQYYLDSFPSGHAALAGASLVVPIMAKYNEKTRGKEWIFFLSATIWMFISMFSRMIDGHHYLSDVAFGAIIGVVLTFAFGYTINFGKRYEKEALEQEAKNE